MSSDGLESMRGSDAPGEAPRTKTAVPHLMRTLTLATAGIMSFGMDALAEFARTSMARGEEMEKGARKLVERYQENAKIQAKAAAASRNDLAKQASVSLDENLRALWRVIVVPSAKEQAVEQLAEPIRPTIEGENSNGYSSASAEKD